MVIQVAPQRMNGLSDRSHSPSVDLLESPNSCATLGQDYPEQVVVEERDGDDTRDGGTTDGTGFWATRNGNSCCRVL